MAATKCESFAEVAGMQRPEAKRQQTRTYCKVSVTCTFFVMFFPNHLFAIVSYCNFIALDRILKRIGSGKSHILDLRVDNGIWVERKRKKVLAELGRTVRVIFYCSFI